MSRQIAWIIIGIIGLILFLVTIVFLINLIVRAVTAPVTVVPTPIPTPPPTITPLPTPTPIQSGPTPFPTPTPFNLTPTPIVLTPTPSIQFFKTYTHPRFSLSYPNTWGILTCSNSQNFEFDPTNNIDQLNIICGIAQKPITIIVDNNLSGCRGQQVNIGGVPTIRSSISAPNFTLHQWCTRTIPVLKITHRVSVTSSRATSPIDFSSEIEQMIGTLRFPTSS